MGLKFQIAWALLHAQAAIFAFALAWRVVKRKGLRWKALAAAAVAWGIMHSGSTGYHSLKAGDELNGY